ncbi:S1 RNA-binding domain-containing protein [Candidatus Amarolinea aalborgensis]|uniref:S1 RNA-binding domain-containing protein n=1 Tax=Candidatus Amarolinea aalborgensis TaxID=2249329 RepID=UPI003BF9E2AF
MTATGDTESTPVEPTADQPIADAATEAPYDTERPADQPIADAATEAPYDTERPEAQEGSADRSGRRRRTRGNGPGVLPIRVIPPKKVVKVLSVGMEIEGVVRRVAEFGAFIDIGVGTDGLVHISELSTGRVGKVSDRLKEGDPVKAWIKELDRDRNRISLTLIEPGTKTIRDLQEGELVKGIVTRVVPYAAFLDIGIGRDAMLHIREMSDSFVRRVEDVANVGDELEVKVLSLDRRRQRIDLSLKGLRPEEAVMAAPELVVTEEMGERPRTGDARGRGRSNEEVPDMETRREREPRGGRSDRSSNGADRGERRSRRDRGSGRERDKEEWHDYLKDDEEAGPTAMALALQAAMVQDAEQDTRRQKRLEKDRDRRRQDDFRTEQEDIVARTLRLRQAA